VDWIGTSNKYFASLLFPVKPFDGGFVLTRKAKPVPDDPEENYFVPSVGGVYNNVTLLSNVPFSLEASCYTGPKSVEEIKKLPESAIGVLHLSYFSFMEFLARPLVVFLKYLKEWCGSYGIAIILLTIIVRVVFWPVTQKANNSMRKMQKVGPMVKELKEKYKDNTQLMNQKMMELYRKEGVNPLGGCLPILLQIPVFLALYSALDASVELRHVSFLWATDLTKPDLVGPQFLFGYGIHPLILIMTALMVLQQKMTPSTGADPMQQKMMMFMPIVMLVMLYNLPSGLTLYWTVSQIFSILQMKYTQYIAKREEEKEAKNSTSEPA
jgi:YidC/Oxa1 family membrane protein insertase